jgi:hypothetical protein
MNLSTYTKIQKTTLAAFCVSIAALLLTSYLMLESAGAAVTTNGVNTIPTNGIFPSPTGSGNTSANGMTSNSNPPTNTKTATNTSNPTNNSGETGGYGLVILGVSSVTAITSLLGFISTTVLSWRKEKREVETIRYDNEKKELELEKLKWELEKLKTAEKEEKPKGKTNVRQPKNPE